ncbi:uncharacterized protein LOC116251272 isoform X1 [Nymphaea colorata]|uniref:uncharacterized protein LOC116251272 isoform X1 n=1 Tax=Nymphaea colorata TaxID=210225 RepID=UPI00129E8175|nr:uncharacterized protein LOC116251272 isoform X1 [Nymphaea colorata]XP_031481298.1 uncharacterized protein LOC116251272 isoform X1 [Nymphaea colorata]XP_049933051.1 uncharacterized protein LOC116251272 isoform X1 [Nymphaea colorata]
MAVNCNMLTIVELANGEILLLLLSGLVRSPVSATLPQIGSRLYVTWGILWSFPEQRHIRVFIFECKEPSCEALRVGITASMLLLLAHVIATVHGGCICVT